TGPRQRARAGAVALAVAAVRVGFGVGVVAVRVAAVGVLVVVVGVGRGALRRRAAEDLVVCQGRALFVHLASLGRTRLYLRGFSRGNAGTLAPAVDLYEYQGKELFRRCGIPVSEGRLATTPEEA